jgi:uncharacterized protein
MLKNVLFWKAVHPNRNMLYLFGTAHLYGQHFVNALEDVRPYLSTCDMFLAEFDLETKNDAIYSLLSQQLEISKGTLRKYKKWCTILRKSFGIDLMRISNFSPFYIVQMINEGLTPSDATVFVDQYLWNMAKQEELNLGGLESMDLQVQYLKNVLEHTGVKELGRIARNPKSYRNQMKDLLLDYQNQNLHILYKKSYRSLGKLRRIMINTRNKNMIKTIITEGEHKKLFVAFGAAHLPGKFGVLAELKRVGYKVVPMEFSF